MLMTMKRMKIMLLKIKMTRTRMRIMVMVRMRITRMINMRIMMPMQVGRSWASQWSWADTLQERFVNKIF